MSNSIAPIQPSSNLTGLWTGNLQLAQKLVELAEVSKIEAEQDMYYRCATSKVYYAFYHYANNYARAFYPGQRFQPPDRRQAHQRLIEWYEQTSSGANAQHVAELAGIHLALDTGRNLRTVVDYEINTRRTSDGRDFGTPQKICQDMHDAAREPMADIDRLIKDFLQQQLAQKMQSGPGGRPRPRRKT